MFLVSGITGRVGGAAARRLLKDGHAVRTLVRNPQKAQEWSNAGVEVRAGDFTDPEAVASALTGVEGAYLMLPPFFTPAAGFPEAKAIIASFRRALSQVLPGRLVALSSIGSEKTSGLGLITQTHLLEQALADLSCPKAYVRAGGFLENLAYAPAAASAAGEFPTYLTPTSRPVPMIATEDIGQEVARLLTAAAWTGTRIVELGSAVSPDDVAQALSTLLNRPVTAKAVPREQWRASLEAQGFSPGGTSAFEEMEDSFNSGWIHFGIPGTEAVPAKVTPLEFFKQLTVS